MSIIAKCHHHVAFQLHHLRRIALPKVVIAMSGHRQMSIIAKGHHRQKSSSPNVIIVKSHHHRMSIIAECHHLLVFQLYHFRRLSLSKVIIAKGGHCQSSPRVITAKSQSLPNVIIAKGQNRQMSTSLVFHLHLLLPIRRPQEDQGCEHRPAHRPRSGPLPSQEGAT